MAVYTFVTTNQNLIIQNIVKGMKNAGIPFPVSANVMAGTVTMDYGAGSLTIAQRNSLQAILDSVVDLKIFTLTCATESLNYIVDEFSTPTLCPKGHAATSVVQRNKDIEPVARGVSPNGTPFVIFIANNGVLVTFADARGI